jgi:hypothetical protein
MIDQKKPQRPETLQFQEKITKRWIKPNPSITQQGNGSNYREQCEQLKAPGAYWDGSEFFTLNPLRNDKHVGSFSVNADTGKFYDFADGTRGHISQLMDDTVRTPETLPEVASQDWATNKWGRYVAHWYYQDPAGHIIGADVRYEQTAGGKNIIPFHKAGNRWKAGHAKAESRPLYNLHELQQKPAVPVLIVEGCKAADAGYAGMVTVTWPGGCKAVSKADWGPLQGRTVYILPDNDQPGREAAEAIQRHLPQARILPVPAGKPQGWDLADATPEDREHIDKSIDPVDNTTPSRRFRWERIGSITILLANWLVENFIEVGTFIMIIGATASYKSFVAISMMMSIASGLPWFGHEVQQGAVCYICGEGKTGILKRFLAWCANHSQKIEELPVYVSTIPAALTESAFMDIVLQSIREDIPESEQLRLVVIDTLNRNFGAGDENSSADTAAVIQACDRIREEFGAAVILIHHSGHMNRERGRGHSSLKAAVDHEYRTDCDESKTIRMECTKMKDHEPPEPIAFRPLVVRIEGYPEEVTSVVLQSTSYEPPAKNGKQGRGKNQTLGMEVLHNLYNKKREQLLQQDRDPGAARIPVNDWSNSCADIGMDRRAFYKVKKSLTDARAVQILYGHAVPLSVSPCPLCPLSKEKGDKGDNTGSSKGTKATQRGRKGDTKGDTGTPGGYDQENEELGIF